MDDQGRADQVRGEALDRIARNERWFQAGFWGAVVFEGAFLVTLLLTADLSNRVERLLVIATVGSYTLIILGLVALGAFVNRSVLRVLTAIDATTGITAPGG